MTRPRLDLHKTSQHPNSSKINSGAVFALIDCNNFFVSCERLFRPDLANKPVVVLSSNDGCAVARSNEAKALGIPMGAPVFKYRDVFRQHNVVQFSANFELYGDISRRITDILTTITPRLEVYSVDESFLDLSQLKISDYTGWGQMVKQSVEKWVGVPVSIGIAPTKTLAKAATARAKKVPKNGGVLSLQGHSLEKRRDELEQIPVGDVWGVGRRYAPKLRAEGVMNAWQLSQLRPRQAQQLMGIHGRQLVAELNGTACHPLQIYDKPAQTIARTRTFGQDVNDINTLQAAIANFAAQAAFRLRQSGQLAQKASLFLATNRHKPGYQHLTHEVVFRVPTADTGQIISALTMALNETLEEHQSASRPNHLPIYGEGLGFYRAGVVLYDFLPKNALQTDLLGEVSPKKADADTARLEAVDYLNEKFGNNRVHYATQDLMPFHNCYKDTGQQAPIPDNPSTARQSLTNCPRCGKALGNKWQPRQKLKSPSYVSNWGELPVIRPI